jgi:hypothetical protein
MSAVLSELLLDQLDTDVLTEDVLRTPDPRTRAAIIAAVVQDLCTAVERVHGQAPAASGRAAAELDGACHLSSTAHSPHLRMSVGAAPARVTR